MKHAKCRKVVGEKSPDDAASLMSLHPWTLEVAVFNSGIRTAAHLRPIPVKRHGQGEKILGKQRLLDRTTSVVRRRADASWEPVHVVETFKVPILWYREFLRPAGTAQGWRRLPVGYSDRAVGCATVGPGRWSQMIFHLDVMATPVGCLRRG